MGEDSLNEDDFVEARDPVTGPYRLGKLSKHSNWKVRAAVATNPSTPSDVLRRMIEEHHYGKPVDGSYFNQQERIIYNCIVLHPNTPPDVLRECYKNDTLCNNIIRSNPSCPVDILLMCDNNIMFTKWTYRWNGDRITIMSPPPLPPINPSPQPTIPAYPQK